jgi:4-hydroxy-tetrahydrodipicolinate synthase
MMEDLSHIAVRATDSTEETNSGSRQLTPFVSIVTCFNRDDTINYSAVRNQVRRQISFGNNILVSDTLGDFTCLTHAEKVRLCAEVVEEADGRVEVWANIGMPSTYQAILIGKDIAELGVDGMTVLAPYFVDCPDEDVVLHYNKVADSLEVPICLYNAPALTMRALSLDVVRTLAAHDNIVGIKDNGADRERMLAYLAFVRSSRDFALYTGNDTLILEALMHGAAGCMSDLGNILPRTLNTLCLMFANGSNREAAKWQALLGELHGDLSSLGNLPMRIKQLLYLMDNSVGTGRQPSPRPTDDEEKRLSALIEKYQIF